MPPGRSNHYIGDGRPKIPPLLGNPYNGYINPHGLGLMIMPYYMEIMGVIYGNNGCLDPNPFEKCSSQEGKEFGAPKGSFVNQGGNNQTLIF